MYIKQYNIADFLIYHCVYVSAHE